MTLLRNRLVTSYAILVIGVLLFIGRRAIFPSLFEGRNLPFGIEVASVLNSCYTVPRLVTCSDPLLVALTALGVAAAASWGSVTLIIITLLLMPMPLLLYFALGPIWGIFLVLLLLPLAMQWGRRFLKLKP